MTSSSTDRRYGVNSNMAIKVPCRSATTANVTLSGEQTVDGVACVTGDRVLVKNQTDGTANGIYLVDTSAWTRALDFDGVYDIVHGTLVYVTNGTVGAGLFYSITTADPITIGSTSVSFAVVSPSSPITLPLAVNQGGTAQTTKTTTAAAFGLVQLTAAGGTANAQTATAPAGYTFATNDIFVYTPSATNSSATTLTITPSGGVALSSKNLFLNAGALVGGEVISGSSVLLQYDGTQLQILGTSSLVTKTTSQTLTNKTLTAPVFSGVPTGTVTSSTYTPTISSTTNVSSSSAATAKYIRVGNTVHVAGRLAIESTSSGGASTHFLITLPIASNIGSVDDLSGTLTADVVGYSSGIVQGDSSTDKAYFQFSSGTASGVTISWYFTFSYTVI